MLLIKNQTLMKFTKQVFILVFSVFCFFHSSGQNAIVRGNVIDRSTGENIPFANVYLEGTTKGTNTDINGFYSLNNVEAGEYKLVSTFIGFDTAYIDIKLGKNTIEYQNIYLDESSVEIDVVSISADRQTARTEVKVSKVTVTSKQITALPSVGGEPDIAQYLQVLPGVISTGDQGGQLYIRGGSPVQNKILLDGLTIYNPFHSIGFFSVFETDLIKTADVYSGAFGAEYGGRISAIVDIQTRDGNKVKHGGFVSLSPFAAKALVEGPLTKFKENASSSSFVFSAKRSLFDQTSQTLYSYAARDPEVGLPFSFQDLYGKLTFKSQNGSSLNLFGFNFQDEFNDPSIARIGWKNSGFGANFDLIPATSSIIMSGSIGFTNYDLGFIDEDADARSSSIRELGANLDFKFFGDNNEFSYGIDLRGITTDFSFLNPFQQTLNQRQSTTELSGYGKYRHVIGNLVIEPSFRFMFYASQNTFSPEPRLGIKYNISDKLRFKAAAGMYSQNILSTSNERDVVNLFNGFLSGPTEQVRGLDGDPLSDKIQRSNHVVGGFEIDVTNNLQLNIEGYYKDFPRLIVVNRNKLTVTEADFLEEEGEAFGVDFSAKYQLPRLYVWATYSYGFVNRFDGEQTFPTVFDRRHNVNFLTTYNLDDAGTWQASVRWNLGSGFPFTQTQGFYNLNQFFEGVSTDVNTANPDEVGILFSQDRNGGRLPYYHRLDLSVTKTIEFSDRFSVDIIASLTNAYNRDNIFFFDRVEFERVDQLPWLPSLSVKASF